jgi:hypothetical protein
MTRGFTPSASSEGARHRRFGNIFTLELPAVMVGALKSQLLLLQLLLILLLLLLLLLLLF